jgi:hypothetical protein
LFGQANTQIPQLEIVTRVTINSTNTVLPELLPQQEDGGPEATLWASACYKVSTHSRTRHGGVPVIPATWEAEVGGFWFKISPDKKLTRPHLKDQARAGCQWLTPVILATQKAEIRIAVQSQPRQIVCETLS